MLIQCFSDIHGEAYHTQFDWLWRHIEPRAPIAIVAGDIHSKYFEEQLNEIATKFKHVVAVLGNHEFYRRDITWRPDKKRLAKNVHVLDRSVWQYYNTVFIGATLWTDFKNLDWFVMDGAKRCINDFHAITAKTNDSYHKFTPHMALDLHIKDKQFIKMMVEKFRQEGKKIVVVTHFMPSYDVVSPKWKQNPGNDTLNYYFSAQCNDLLEMEGIKYFVNGHTHDFIDTVVGNTRVVCNPLGYPNERFNNKEPYEDFLIEV